MEVRTEIEIQAAPSAVWAVLTDLAGYSEWNPFVPRASGDLRPGGQVELSVSMPDGSDADVRTEVLAVEAGRELRLRRRWLLPGLFDGVHFVRLVELGPDRTRVVHGEDFTGLLVKPLLGAITRATRGFVFMNQALKRRVEAAG